MTNDSQNDAPRERQITPGGQPSNLFDGSRIQPADNLAASIGGQAALAKIQSRMMLALAKPRNVMAIRQHALEEAGRFQFADSAVDVLPFGGERVEIETIRFAELMLRLWGHNEVELDVVAERPDKRERDVRASIMDFQTGFSISDTMTISTLVERNQLRKGQKPHSTRSNSYGDTVYMVEPAPNELWAATQAAKSRLMRSVGSRFIDKWLWDEVAQKCRETVQKKIDTDPQGEVKRVVDGLSILGIKVADVEEALGFAIDKMTKPDIVMVRNWWKAVESSQTTWADIVAESVARRAARKTTSPGDGAPAGGTTPGATTPKTSKPANAEDLKKDRADAKKTAATKANAATKTAPPEESEDELDLPATGIIPAEITGERVVEPAIKADAVIPPPAAKTTPPGPMDEAKQKEAIARKIGALRTDPKTKEITERSITQVMNESGKTKVALLSAAELGEIVKTVEAAFGGVN